MGQHKSNPTAIAAKKGQIKPIDEKEFINRYVAEQNRLFKQYGAEEAFDKCKASCEAEARILLSTGYKCINTYNRLTDEQKVVYPLLASVITDLLYRTFVKNGDLSSLDYGGSNLLTNIKLAIEPSVKKAYPKYCDDNLLTVLANTCLTNLLMIIQSIGGDIKKYESMIRK